MKAPIILDLDSVVFQVEELMQHAFHCEFGVYYPISDWSTYFLEDLYGVPMSDLLKALVTHQVLERVVPYPGAVEAVAKLHDAGYPIIICTSRGYHPDAENVTRTALLEHGILYTHLVIPEGFNSKIDSCKRYATEFSYCIDDHSTQVQTAVNSGLVQKGILINQPWNQSHPHTAAITRHQSLVEFTEAILS